MECGDGTVTCNLRGARWLTQAVLVVFFFLFFLFFFLFPLDGCSLYGHQYGNGLLL